MRANVSRKPTPASNKHCQLLAEACGQTGYTAEGLTLLAEALAQAHKTGEFWTEAELHRLKGELLLRQAVSNVQQEEIYLHQDLAVARCQQTKSLGLRAATSLSRLWQQQGKSGDNPPMGACSTMTN